MNLKKLFQRRPSRRDAEERAFQQLLGQLDEVIRTYEQHLANPDQFPLIYRADEDEMPPLEFAPEHPRLKFNVERSEWARLALIAENNGLPLEAQAHFALVEWLEWAEAELVRQPKQRAQPRPSGGHLPPEAGPPPTDPPPKPPPSKKTRKNP